MHVDGISTREFGVQIFSEDFDVARFVYYLRGRVVLSIHPWHRLYDFGGADHGSLFTMHELAKRPVLGFHIELDPLITSPRLDTCAFEIQ